MLNPNYHSRLSFFFVAFFLVVFSMPLHTGNLLSAGIVNPAFFKITYTTLGLCIVGLLLFLPTFKLKAYRSTSPIQKSLIVFVIFASLSSLWSIHFDYTASEIFALCAAGIAFSATSYLYTSSAESINKLLVGIFISIVIVSLLGVADSWIGTKLFDSNKTHSASVFGNKNFAMHAVVMCWPLGAFLLLRTASNQTSNLFTKFFITIGLSIIALHLLYAETRAAWVALFCQLLALGVFVKFLIPKPLSYPSIRFLLVIPLAVVLIYNITPHKSLIGEPVSATSFQQKSTVSANTRFGLWESTFQGIKAAPILGHGFNSFPAGRYIHGSFGANNIRVHNEYLQLLYELGIVGLGLFGLIVLSVAFCLRKLLVNPEVAANEKMLLASITVALVGTGAQSFFTFPYKLLICTVYLAIYLAIIHTLYLKYSYSTVEEKSTFSPLKSIVLLLLLISTSSNIGWLADFHMLNRLTAIEDATDKEKNGLSHLVQTPWLPLMASNLTPKKASYIIARMESNLKYDPYDIRALSKLVEIYQIAKLPDMAQPYYVKIYQHVLKQNAFHRLLGGYFKTLREQGKHEEANRLFDNINANVKKQDLMKTRWHPTDAYSMGDFASMFGNFKDAIKYYKLALRGSNHTIGTNQAFFYTSLATAYDKIGNHVAANEWYKEAMHHHPDHPIKKQILRRLDQKLPGSSNK